MGAAVEVDELVVRHGEVVAVDGISFTAAAGEVLALLGPNGAGKTSTVETLEGYRSPTAGAVRVLGLDPLVDHRRLVPRIGVMLQSGGVYTGIRPPEVLSLFASYYDNPRDPDELLALVGLEHRRRATFKTLSGGEQQRLSLALALIGRPDVAFLDEPTAGVDPSGRQTIREIVTSLRDDGVCVVLTTHDLDDAERLADRIVIIDHGRVVADGTPDELVRSPSAQVLFRTAAGIDVAGLAAAVGLAPGGVREILPGEYEITAASTPELLAALTAWLAGAGHTLDDLRAGRQRLEDVFLRLTGDDAADASTANPSAPDAARDTAAEADDERYESDER